MSNPIGFPSLLPFVVSEREQLTSPRATARTVITALRVLLDFIAPPYYEGFDLAGWTPGAASHRDERFNKAQSHGPEE